jgi:uncharacterized membrane protein
LSAAVRKQEDPRELAHELLGRQFDDLDADEQRVLCRVASGSFVGMDAEELAQAHSGRGELLADRVAAIGGSWGFIIGFGVVLLVWVLLNTGALQAAGLAPFDGYPFIFLNLMLSMLAAVQAPIILMSQNRQAAKDRVAARHDYEVNLRTQLEIIRLSHKLDRMAAELARIDRRDNGA